MSARRLAFATLILLSSTAIGAATEAFDACAAAGASRFEPGFEDIGPVDRVSFYPYDAIQACERALEEDPGNVQLMAWLGHGYAADNQVPKGLSYLEQAASAGNMLAQRTLGDLLILGKGIAQDKVRGIDLLHRSASQGYPPAQLSLGYSYDYGDGVPTDPAKAMEFYLAAAEAGMTKAQLIAADRYRRGIGVPVDDAAAFRWTAAAADSGDGEALYRMGVAYLEGRGVEASASDALAAFQVSADANNDRGSTALGYMVELGIATDIDLQRAADLYSPGRYANHPLSKYNLARLQEIGAGVDADPENARMLYEEAAKAEADKSSPLRAVVASCRPESTGFAAHAETLAADKRVKGLRRILHASDAVPARSASFIENLRRLPALGLSFDLCLRADQLRLGMELADQCPGVQFFLDHCGNPAVAQGQAAVEPWLSL